ncbi:MAG: pyridoxal phosphate-dependent aminotransferase [Bacteroidetes bacterium]|nr:pyridoxal phosphate-dependent aminotransferase [Bacteroidota bacterium]MBP6426327.1 pyridoxal phosphate-dependent aminotransferase [Bacteroidia bacterium]MBK8365795.1 pyridoxal phosphate-dependent aminotransferase [Bacteroidota bacterium]MBK9412491.1 pyridoxal phosphate-dependent aminotransferase [Bacteroidota bacterium]MBL0032207.1 pyridoxal phosphate-dependent aminotransferase [Bacteroidota bacterium]
MPITSIKGRQMPPSPIRKLVPFAEKAKKEGKKIYHLNIGQPDIETPQTMINAIHNFSQKVVEYSHSAGIESYRRKLTGYYKRFDIELDYTEIIITTGGSEAIEIAMMSCMDPGDEILIPEPFYANYNGFSTQANVKVIPIRSTIETGFALPPISEFEKLITPRTKAIMICNPSNPTGYLYSKDELEKLRDLVKKHDLWFFSDEVYREFCYDGNEYTSVMNLAGIENNVVMLDSISKRYSACGARIGALVSRNKDLMATALKFAQARLSPPTFGQVAAEAAIDTPDEYFTKVKSEYVSRRDFVVKALNEMDGVFCPKPNGAFYCIARLPIDNADKFCQWLLEDFAYENETVMLAPATGFYSRPDLGTDEVRIAYVLNLTDLSKAMKCLSEALKVYPGKTAKLEMAGKN